MTPIRVMHILGARPNFMKVAPIWMEMSRHPDTFDQVLVHTGQHYDHRMSAAFLEQLGLPDPDECLNVGSGSHAQQTAKIMVAFEPVLFRHRPDWVFVAGDVNSTLACALVCAKAGIRLAHVEAGLRSGDRSMPEEINRIVTDHLSDVLFTPSPDANSNLIEEGIRPDQIRFVGNVMIDSVVRMMPRAAYCRIIDELALRSRSYALVTLHRPSNVDDQRTLNDLLECLGELSKVIPVVFPVHPRTLRRISEPGGVTLPKTVHVLEALDYVSFLALMASARLVVTDSGGVQEETTYLGVPCLTIRPNTERPVTISCGTNRLVPNTAELLSAAQDTIMRPPQPARIPELWDGKAAQRIARSIAERERGEASTVHTRGGAKVSPSVATAVE